MKRLTDTQLDVLRLIAEGQTLGDYVPRYRPGARRGRGAFPVTIATRAAVQLVKKGLVEIDYRSVNGYALTQAGADVLARHTSVRALALRGAQVTQQHEGGLNLAARRTFPSPSEPLTWRAAVARAKAMSRTGREAEIVVIESGRVARTYRDGEEYSWSPEDEADARAHRQGQLERTVFVRLASEQRVR